MANSVLYMHNGPSGPGFYFLDKTWTDLYGPYKSEEEAVSAQGNYTHTTAQDFWAQQYSDSKEGEIIPDKSTQEERTIAWELVDKTSIRPDRVFIKDINDLQNIYGLVDAGYLSFVYGSRQGYGGWDSVRYQYGNFLFLMDSGGVRSKEYPLYKSKRKERREAYDYMAETYERVKAFREYLIMDPIVNTAILEGYEADDLIAILMIKGVGTEKIIAQDKDLFMIPGARNIMTDHTGLPQGSRGLKLPKYAIVPNRPATWALTQAIFGDKSDTIPRLLPSRVGYKEIYNDCVRKAPNLLSAFWNTYAQFGDQFLVNLRLVLLPHPSLSISDQGYKSGQPHLLFEDLCSGDYWHPDNYSDKLLQTVVDSTTTTTDNEWI